MKPFSYHHRAFCAAMVLLPVCLSGSSFGANAPARRFVVLHRFNGTDGSSPLGPLVQDAAGNLYGETEIGGSNGAGVVFELSPHGSRWTETVLHDFNYETEGSNPLGGLTLDDQGNLYGTEFSSASNGGGVFELSPAGKGAWNFIQIYRFDGNSPQGSNPYSGVLRDKSANLYGTTYYGGAKLRGVVFQLSPAEGGGWTESVLHSFGKRPDGAYPAAGVIRDSSGNLYGTTTAGGDGHCGDGEGDPSGCGTVFELTPAGKRSAETQLYDFQKDESNFPYAPLTLGPDGLLYGTVEYDVFVLTPQDGGAWQKQVIYEFKEGEDGTITASGLTFDTAGNLYGTTRSSGLDGFGTVYELSPPAPGQQKWTHSTLAKMGKGFAGNRPDGGILLGSDGTLYGAAGEPGIVFAIR